MCIALAAVFHVVYFSSKLQERVDLMLRVAQVSLPRSVWFLDYPAAQSVLEAMMQDPELSCVQLLSPDGEIASMCQPGVNASLLQDQESNWSHFVRSAPLTYEGETIGQFRLAYSKGSLYTVLLSDAAAAALLTALLMAAISWRSIRLTRRLIFTPLQSLAASAQAISRGELEKPVTLHSQDEIGDLASSLDAMRLSLKDLFDQLHTANAELEHKVDERTAELAEKNRELISLLAETAAYNKMINESLNYARRILAALIPEREALREFVPQSFLLWKPRDIVGGDVYFVHKSSQGVLLAVMDCTGHGVPGAFITILALAGMRIIVEKPGVAFDPARTLQELNAYVKTSLRQESANIERERISDDGLDAGVCFIPNGGNTIVYAGARTPIIGLRDGEPFTINGDKKSLGYRRSDSDHQFTNHSITFEKDFIGLITTDGLTDQLDDAKSLPFGKKRLRRFIQKNHDQGPFKALGEKLHTKLMEHAGTREQLDDITVLGFRLTA